MSPHLLRRTPLLIPLWLTALAGCTDTETMAPRLASKPQLAQGAGGVWTVSSLADPGDGTCDDTNCTLREAVGAATPGGQIVFASGLQGTIALSGAGPIEFSKRLSIDGGGRVTLDAQSAHGVMVIGNDPTGVDMPVTLAGLTLENGRSADGAGLSVGEFAVVTIRNSVVTGNLATGSGGGIWM